MADYLIAREAGVFLRSQTDIPELIGACYGCDGVLLTVDDLAPEFLDLKTRLLGELFQKCANYRLKVGFVVPDATAYGERFSELAYEHAVHPQIRFFTDGDAAREWLVAS